MNEMRKQIELIKEQVEIFIKIQEKSIEEHDDESEKYFDKGDKSQGNFALGYACGKFNAVKDLYEIKNQLEQILLLKEGN